MNLLVLVLSFLFLNGVLMKPDDETLMKYKHYESYVEFDRAEFTMGCNDRHGINYECPPKIAKVDAFRLTKKIEKLKNYLFGRVLF
jgi:hypothetical protein